MKQSFQFSSFEKFQQKAWDELRLNPSLSSLQLWINVPLWMSSLNLQLTAKLKPQDYECTFQHVLHPDITLLIQF